MNKDLVCKKKEIKCNNEIKQYKKCSYLKNITKQYINVLIILQKKT